MILLITRDLMLSIGMYMTSLLKTSIH